MAAATVTNKEELKVAQANKAHEILVVGDFAEQLHKTRKVQKYVKRGVAGLAALGAAVAALVATAPASGPGVAVLSFAGGSLVFGETAAIIAVSFIGVSVVFALWKDYEEIEFTAQGMKLRRKSKEA